MMLEQLVDKEGLQAAAQELVERMRQQKLYPELFEARKMLHRVELGLPPVHVDPIGAQGKKSGAIQQDPQVQDELDKRLLDACREVGGGLMRSGRLQEGWMYLRAVGDDAFASEAMAAVEPTQDNLDLLLNLYVHEGVDIGRGTELCLKMRGTCNTITMLDSIVAMRGRSDQQAAVEALVKHVHQELLANLIADVTRRMPQVQAPEDRSIVAWLGLVPGLLRDGTYHLDTTHLASTVRFARVLDDPSTLKLAADLAEYGRQLHAQYQYSSEEPFADLYPMSLAWFRALMGEHVDAALRVFRQKAESIDLEEHGTIGIETYADLLARIGRPDEAGKYLIRTMPDGMRPFGVAPSLIELSSASGEFQPMKDHAKQRGDLIGFAAALLQSKHPQTN
ncbi:MAG: hypothetical protein DWH99_02865 [Planctomycetota bacterium]|nr:MAG: hypothetical protein DWH99_02865 [Planctomycetota bacterium]